eukprot:6976007-Prymnesium_polylepis.1
MAGLINCDQLINYRDAFSGFTSRPRSLCAVSMCRHPPPAPSPFAPHAIPARLTLASRPPLS